MNEALVSVIVPVYKAEKWLEACVKGLINQTYRNIEILLVDDGSPDNSGTMCDEYAKNDSRIKVVHKENGGVSSARNVGIENSNGEYLVFVDSDDIVGVRMIENLWLRMKETEADIVIAGRTEFYGDNEKQYSELNEEYNQHDFFVRFLEDYAKKTRILASPWAKLYRKAIIEQEPKLRYVKRDAEDKIFNVEYFLRCEKIAFCDDCSYKYRVAASGESTFARYTVEGKHKSTEDTFAAFKKVLPEMSEEIDRVCELRKLMNTVGTVHLAVINGSKRPYKVEFSWVKTVLGNSKSTVEKLSVFLLWLLPDGLYRAFYKLYYKLPVRE